MQEKTDNIVQNLKKEWHAARQALAQWDQILAQRNTIETEILQMQTKTKLESDKNEFIRLAKERKQKLDHRLDEIEEYTPEVVEKMRLAFIEAVLEIHPEHIGTYKFLEKKLAELQQIYEGLLKLCEICKELLEKLDGIIAIRAKIRKKGIFSYIFGENPTMAIAHNLKEIHRISERGLEEIKEQPEQIIPSQLKPFLEKMKHESQKSWGFRALDTTFKEAHEEVIQLNEILQKNLKEVEKAIGENEQKINLWLDQL